MRQSLANLAVRVRVSTSRFCEGSFSLGEQMPPSRGGDVGPHLHDGGADPRPVPVIAPRRSPTEPEPPGADMTQQFVGVPQAVPVNRWGRGPRVRVERARVVAEPDVEVSVPRLAVPTRWILTGATDVEELEECARVPGVGDA